MVTVPKVNRVQIRPDATPYQDASNILRAMQVSGELDIRNLQHIGQTAANIKENELQAKRDAEAAERARIAQERHLTSEQRYAAAEARRVAAEQRRIAKEQQDAKDANDKKVSGAAVVGWRNRRTEIDKQVNSLQGEEQLQTIQSILENEEAEEAARTVHLSEAQRAMYTEKTYATRFTYYSGLREKLGKAIKQSQIVAAEAGVITAANTIATSEQPLDAATTFEIAKSIRDDLIAKATAEGFVDYEAIDIQVSQTLSESYGKAIQHRINARDYESAEAILNQTTSDDMRLLTWMDPELHGKLTKNLQELKDEEIPSRIFEPEKREGMGGEIDYSADEAEYNKQVREVMAKYNLTAVQKENAQKYADGHRKRWKEVDDENHDNVLVAIAKDGRATEHASFEQFLTQNKEIAEFLQVSKRPGFYEKAKAAWMAGAENDGHAVKSEKGLMTSLFKMKRNELAALDPEDYIHKLSAEDFAAFEDEWRRVTRFMEDQSAKNVSFTQAEERVKNFFVMNPQTGSPRERAEQQGELIYNMTLWMNEMIDAEGALPTVTEQEEYLRLITEPGGGGYRESRFPIWPFNDPEPVSLVERWSGTSPGSRRIGQWDDFSKSEQLNAVAILQDNELVGAEGFSPRDAAMVASSVRFFPRDVDRLERVVADIRARKARAEVPYWYSAMTASEKTAHMRNMEEVMEQFKAATEALPQPVEKTPAPQSAAPVEEKSEMTDKSLAKSIRAASPVNLVKPADESEAANKATFMSRTRFFEGTGPGSGGDKYTVFQDPEAGKPGKPKDIPLIGYGFNLNRPDAKKVLEDLGYDYDEVRAGKQSIDSRAVNHLMEKVWEENTAFARKTWKNFDSLSNNRKLALLDLIYTMGTDRLSANKAKKTKQAIEAEDWEGLMKLYPENGAYHSQIKDRRWVPFKKAIMEG